MKRAILPSELSITEYARITGKQRRSVARLVRLGRLPARSVGRKQYISLGALEDMYPVEWHDLLKCWGRMEASLLEDDYDN